MKYDCYPYVKRRTQIRKYVLMTSACLPELVQGVYKNWEQLYLNNLISRKSIWPLYARSRRKQGHQTQCAAGMFLANDGAFHVQESWPVYAAWKTLRLGKIFFSWQSRKHWLLGNWAWQKKKLTSVTNDGGENMYVSTTGVKTSGKEILTALDSTYLRKQAFPIMNFRESKFCSELNP